MLTVDAADALVFTKAFSPDTIAPGGISRLTFTIDNGANLIDVGSLAFTPSRRGRDGDGGGTFAPGASDVSLAFAGGAVAAGDACAISVDVTSCGKRGRSDVGPAGHLNEAPLVVSMGFSPSTIAQGGVSRLSYDLGNDAAVGATFVVRHAARRCDGGRDADGGGGRRTIAFADGELAAGDTCAISVDVTSAVAGSYLNGPEAVTSSLGASTPVQATLTVDAADALVFTKAFSPDTSGRDFQADVRQWGQPDRCRVAGLYAFPAGLVVAGTPNGSTTCGGTFAPGASDVSLAFARRCCGGDACAISVDVTEATRTRRAL